MGRHYHFLLPLLSLFVVRVDLTDLFALSVEVPELQVRDGDTVRVKIAGSWQRVRIALIDAPELGQLDKGVDLGKYSAKCLEKNLKRPWKVRVYGFDLYGRILGDVNNVSLSMIRQGCAYLYPYSRFNSLYEKGLYVDSQRLARKSRSGLWKFKVLNPYHYRRSRAKFQ